MQWKDYLRQILLTKQKVGLLDLQFKRYKTSTLTIKGVYKKEHHQGFYFTMKDCLLFQRKVTNSKESSLWKIKIIIPSLLFWWVWSCLVDVSWKIEKLLIFLNCSHSWRFFFFSATCDLTLFFSLSGSDSHPAQPRLKTHKYLPYKRLSIFLWWQTENTPAYIDGMYRVQNRKILVGRWSERLALKSRNSVMKLSWAFLWLTLPSGSDGLKRKQN